MTIKEFAGALAALTALALCVPALAQEVSTPATPAAALEPAAAPDASRGQLWLDTGFATYHFQKDRDLNGRNPGYGVEYRWSDSVALTAGHFYNSDRQHSSYAGVYYQPWRVAGIKLGAVAGGFNGYPMMRDGGWFLAIIPVATWEYQRVGVNVAVVPTYKERLHGGISVQLKFKLFD